VPVIQQEQKAPDSEKGAARPVRAAGEGPASSPLLPVDVLTPQSLLSLQGAAGNGAVAALLARRAAPATAPAAPKQLEQAIPALAEAPESGKDAESPVEAAVEPESAPVAEADQPESEESVPVAAESLDLHEQVSAAESSPGARQLIQQAGAAHDESQTHLRTMIETSSGRIEQVVATEHTNLDAAAAAHTATVRGAIASARTSLSSAAGAHKAKARESHQAQAARLQTWKQQAGATAQTAAKGRADRAQTTGSAHAAQAVQDADKAAEDMQTQVATQVQEARKIGARKAQAPGTTEAVRAAKAAAAREISDDTAGKIQAGLGQADQQVRDQGRQLGESLTQQTNQIVTQLDAQVPAILGHISTVHQTAQQSLDTGLTTSADAISKVHGTAGKAMNALETQAVSQVKSEVDKHKQRLTTAGKQAVQQLRQRGAAASAAGSKALGQVSKLAAGSQLEPEQASSLSDETAAQFRQAFDAAGNATQQTAASLAAGFVESGTKVTAGIVTAATQAKSHTDTQVNAVHKQFADVVQQHATKTSALASNAMTAGDSTVAQVGTDLDTHLSQAQASFGGVLAQFGSQLATNVAGSTTNAQQPVTTLDSRIQTAQDKAEADAKKGWWAKQWDDIKDMVTSPAFLTGLVVGLLVAAAVVLILLSAGTATPFIVMAAGVAGGMAAGAASTMVSNAQKGEDILQANVLTNALIGGLAGGVAAGLVLFGGGVIAGLSLTGTSAAVGGFIVLEVAAVGSTILSNVLTGGWKNWDRGIIGAMLLAPLIGRLAKAIGLDPLGKAVEEQQGKKAPLIEGEEQQPKLSGGRVEDPVPGLFDSIDPAQWPDGWTFKDVEVTRDGIRYVVTEVTGPNGKTGIFQRGWNPVTNELVMDEAFRRGAPSWIENDVPMKPGKGTPTQTYVTLRIMKILGVGFGEPVSARMNHIQNFEAILQLEQQVRAGVPPDEAVMKTESMSYGTTNVQQAGKQVVSAHVEGGSRTPIEIMLEHYETNGGRRPPDPAVVAADDALLNQYGFQRTDQMLWNYDIEIKLRPGK
jgi:hypothetical protein